MYMYMLLQSQAIILDSFYNYYVYLHVKIWAGKKVFISVQHVIELSCHLYYVDIGCMYMYKENYHS